MLGCVASVLFAINVLLIAVVNTLVVPPTCPSKVIWLELTSPVISNVLALVSLFAFVERPVTVPVILRIIFPLNSTACTADQRLSLVPNEYCCVDVESVVILTEWLFECSVLGQIAQQRIYKRFWECLFL